MKPKYLTVQDNPLMGLDNAVCKSPVAFCISKRVYLSPDDLAKKKCTHKPTVDLIGAVRCNWLRMLGDEAQWKQGNKQRRRTAKSSFSPQCKDTPTGAAKAVMACTASRATCTVGFLTRSPNYGVKSVSKTRLRTKGVSQMKSNCLLQALQHRLKGCPVYRVIPHNSDWNKHFVWWDADAGTYKHFTWVNEVYLPKIPYLTTFEGRVENYPYDRDRVRLKFMF